MTKKIDPRIYLPPVEGYEYEDTTKDRWEVIPDPFEINLPPLTGGGLQPPSEVTVVEQIYRKDAAGRTVVDLVIEVQDMPGATEYEIRTSVA